MKTNKKKVVLGFRSKLSGDNFVFNKNLMRRGRILKCFCIALLAAAVVQPLPGYSGDLDFQNISIEDGLSQNTISCILQDRHSFMWFGSEEGLNRYDGFRFKVYRHNRSGRDCLSHDRVSCLLEDADGSLWIGTLGGGLNHLDAAREHFSQFRYQCR